MIRVRIERDPDDILERVPENRGMVWYEDGKIVGRVIIEELEVSPHYGEYNKWVPVEVING